MTTSQYVLDAGPMISTSDDFSSLPAATDWVKITGDYVVQIVGAAGTQLGWFVERSARDPAASAGPSISPAPSSSSEGGMNTDGSARANQFHESGFAWVRARLTAGAFPIHVSISGRTW